MCVSTVPVLNADKSGRTLPVKVKLEASLHMKPIDMSSWSRASAEMRDFPNLQGH